MPQEYHNARSNRRSRYWRSSDNVFIYNVPKSLVQKRGQSWSVGMKYADSEDGYAHFRVSDEELNYSKNDKFYHVIMPVHESRTLNYIKDGKEIGVEISPKDLKAAFEKVRMSKKPSKKYADRDLPEVNDGNDVSLPNISSDEDLFEDAF